MSSIMSAVNCSNGKPCTSRTRNREEKKPQSTATAKIGNTDEYNRKVKTWAVNMQPITSVGGFQAEVTGAKGLQQNNTFRENRLSLPAIYSWTGAEENSASLGWGFNSDFIPDHSGLKQHFAGLQLKAKLGGQIARAETDIPADEPGGRLTKQYTVGGEVKLVKTEGPWDGLGLGVNLAVANKKVELGFLLGLTNPSAPYQDKVTQDVHIAALTLDIPVAPDWDLQLSDRLTNVQVSHELYDQGIIPNYDYEATSHELRAGVRTYLPSGTIEGGITTSIGQAPGSGMGIDLDPARSLGADLAYKQFGSDSDKDITARIYYKPIEGSAKNPKTLDVRTAAAATALHTQSLGSFREEISSKTAGLEIKQGKKSVGVSYQERKDHNNVSSALPPLNRPGTWRENAVKIDLSFPVTETLQATLNAQIGKAQAEQFGQASSYQTSAIGFSISGAF